MATFVEFKKLETKSILINPDTIIAIHYRNEEETLIYCQGIDVVFAVNHATEEVLKMIKGRKSTDKQSGMVDV